MKICICDTWTLYESVEVSVPAFPPNGGHVLIDFDHCPFCGEKLIENGKERQT